ncbi:MAG: response regulator [Bacteroidales bacterium]|nr:response regulator [Bacteroidales bacterium]
MELPRILYVDDEVINLELLQLTFMNDFKVLTAASAKEGLRLLELNPDIHVVISDLKMPVMDGLDFIKVVKQIDPAKVCMLLTGFMESDVMLEGFNKELIFRYLMKPWEKDHLKETIREALKR